MRENYTKPWKVRKEILAKLKEKPMTQRELVDGIKPKPYQSTVSLNLKTLIYKEEKIETFKEKDENTGKIVTKYKLIEDKTISDPKQIKENIDLIESGGKAKEIGLGDLRMICCSKKITDRESFEFLVNKVKNTKEKEDREKFFECLHLTVSNIANDGNQKLDAFLDDNVDLNYFKGKVLDEKEDMWVRAWCWRMLEAMNVCENDMVNIAFKLIKTTDERLENDKDVVNFYSQHIQSIIKKYCETNGVEADKRVKKLLKDKGKLVRKRAYDILRTTSAKRRLDL